MLKLYTDITLLTEENRSRVFPLLFDLVYVKSDRLLEHYELVYSIEDADILVLPLDYGFMNKRFKNEYNQFYNSAILTQKPFWIYTGGDFGYTINTKNIYEFRLGGFKSKLNNRTFILPSFINDPYGSDMLPEFKINEKQEKPNVGFVGHANGGSGKLLKEIFSFIKTNANRILKSKKQDYQPFYPSSVKRFQFLKTLKNSKLLKTNFIYRDTYRAGVKSEFERKNTTKEFFENIYQNDYTFCLRGAGNFSVRLYETLAMGRIPFLFDTNCALPLSDIIDWSKHGIIVSEDDYKEADKHLQNFHNQLDDDEFEELQKTNRELWENLMTRHGYFIKIHQLFKAKLND